MASTTIFSDIDPANVEALEGWIELSNGTSQRVLQTDNLFTLIANYPGEDFHPTLPSPKSSEFEWMSIANAEIGEREVDGAGSNPRILAYLATTTAGAQHDEVPWCSAFVNYCIVNSGIRGTNSARARSWLEWGVPCAKPVPGCVVVLRRGDPPKGHVGFYAGMRDLNTVLLLGGNQSNAVGIAGFAADRIVGMRLPAADMRGRPSPLQTGARWDAALSAARTTGASAATAAQDGLAAGVDASFAMATKDLAHIGPYAELFKDAGVRYVVPPSLLAAIASRESRMGTVLRPDGFGIDGHAFGIMQIDKRAHVVRGQSPSSQEHVFQAAEILTSYRSVMLTRHPDWEDEQILRGAIAAYNCGPGRVRDVERLDAATTGGDYSSDVVARARVFADQL